MIITGVIVVISLFAIFYISALIVKNPGPNKQMNDDAEAAELKNDNQETAKLNDNSEDSFV